MMGTWRAAMNWLDPEEVREWLEAHPDYADTTVKAKDAAVEFVKAFAKASPLDMESGGKFPVQVWDAACLIARRLGGGDEAD